jgi:SET family sugar efflux transporter-like MFS transporter
MLSVLVNFWNDRLLRIAFLCILMMGTAIASIVPFQSVIGIEQLGFTSTQYAILMIIGSFIGVTASVSAGIYCDQTGYYKQVLITCISTGIVAGCLMYFLPTKFSFILFHALLAPLAFTAFTQYFALASLSAARNKHINKDFSMSLIRASFAGSFALTPPLWALLIANGVELITVYGFIAFVHVIILALVLTNWPNKHQSEPEQKSGMSFLQALKELTSKSILARLFLISLMTGSNALYNIILGLLILNNLGGTESDVGYFAGGVALMEVPIMLGSAIILRHMSRTQLMFVGMVIYAGFLIGISSFQTLQYAWFLIIPAGFGAGILLSVPLSYIQELKSNRPGASSALISVSQVMAMVIASSIFAMGSYFTDYAGIAWIGAALGLIASALLLALDRNNPMLHTHR